MIRDCIIAAAIILGALHFIDRADRGVAARQSGELCGYAVECRP